MFLFPKWTNRLKYVVAAAGLFAPVYATAFFWYIASPKTTDVGYAPVQPVPYSHRVHAGDLKMDCRYCHGPVERGARATLPPTQTCMNCHATIATDKETTSPVRESYASGTPIAWRAVHDLPDYVYFNHSVHVARGVGCSTCHGRIDQMEVVAQVQPLSMGWCLDCHRDPGPYLRPLEDVTRMDWVPGSASGNAGATGTRSVVPSTDCSTCHR